MSRTYRRKNDERNWSAYHDEAEFNKIKERLESGNPKPDWKTDPEEWRDYCNALYFRHSSYGSQTFKEWQRVDKARFHSDCEPGNRPYRRAPGWFITQFCQRPFRSRCKQVVRKALQTDSWDGIAFPLFIHDAAWKYD